MKKSFVQAQRAWTEFARSTSPFAKSSKTVRSSCGTVLSSAARTSMNDFVDWILICSIGTVRFAIVGMISNPCDIRDLCLVAPHGTELNASGFNFFRKSLRLPGKLR